MPFLGAHQRAEVAGQIFILKSDGQTNIKGHSQDVLQQPLEL